MEATPQKKIFSGKLIWGLSAVYSFLVYNIFHEQFISGFDPGSFFLAIKYGFSLEANRPHPPGYPLFVGSWQKIVSIFHVDPHSAIIILNCFLLFASIVCCFYFVRRIRGEQIAIITTLLLAINPVVIYYSAVAETYIYDVFFSLFTLYLVISLKPKILPVVFFWIGIALGFRLSSVILLTPAIAAAFYYRSDRKELLHYRSIISSILLFIAGVFLWAYPFYLSHGGISFLIKAITDAAGEYHSTIYQNISALASYFLWSVNIGIVFIFARRKSQDQIRQKYLLLIGFIVPLIFFIFGHYAKGYILLVIVPILILIARSISLLRNRKMIMIGIVFANYALFLFVPFITPSIESTLPKLRRSASERFETAAIRSFSFFAPTLTHIRNIDKITATTLALLNNRPKNAFVFIDNSGAEWVYPRSLQCLDSNLHFIQIDKDSNLLDYHGSETSTLSKEDFLAHDTIWYITDPRLGSLIGKPPQAEMIGEMNLVLYRITSQDKTDFWNYLPK